MKKNIIIALASVAIVAIMTGNVFAWSQLIYGEPNIQPGKDKGTFYWLDDKGFHLRFTAPGKNRVFWGQVTTPDESPLTITKKVGFDGADYIKKLKPCKYEYKITINNNKIKGFDFTTKANRMGFLMKMDGKKVLKQSFFAGKNKTPFQHTPFVIFDVKPGEKGIHPDAMKTVD